MLNILEIIIIFVVFGFMMISYKENNRRHQERMNEIKNELKKKGKLPSQKKMILTLSAVIGLMLPLPIILTIIVIYVRKLEFSAEIFFSIIAMFFIFELIIGSIIYYIQHFIIDCKKVGVKKTSITFLFALIATAIVLYIRYNW